MEKINIAKILKDCPKGTLLYATVHGEVKLSRITSSENYPIEVELDSGADLFTEDGRMYPNKGECVLFPSKDQRDWSKFQRPFKDGDIVVNKMGKPFILKSYDLLKNYVCTYCGISCYDNFELSSENWTCARDIRYATEKEKQKLFDAIKANGYRWNAETKILEKLVEPKFKVGYRIKNKKSGICDKVIKIFEDCYLVESFLGRQATISFDIQDNWELVPDKFDINTLIPFESRVLVRDSDNGSWCPSFFGCCKKDNYSIAYNTIRGFYRQCIPYEGNEHLLGKTDDCANFYKTWE